MPDIVTSHWRASLPAGYAPIGISRGTPRGRAGYRRYTKLEPGKWFSSTGFEEFTHLYNEEVLGPLDPEVVMKDLLELAGGRTPALLCWEHEGFGWSHPKLHPDVRRSSGPTS